MTKIQIITAGTSCGKENDADLLDSLTLKTYYDINNALSLNREACEKLLLDIYDKAKTWLHPSHWLLYKLSDCLQFISKELAIETRGYADASIHAKHVNVHKQHALLLLNGIGVFHENENLVCVIKERAANALRTYVDTFLLVDSHGDHNVQLEKVKLRDELVNKANALEREAIKVQRNIRGLL